MKVHGGTYTITRIWGRYPTQAEGRTSNNRPFYFQARYGAWLLEVGPIDAPTMRSGWLLRGLEICGGLDPTCGSMSDQQVIEVIDIALRGNATKLGVPSAST